MIVCKGNVALLVEIKLYFHVPIVKELTVILMEGVNPSHAIIAGGIVETESFIAYKAESEE